MLILQKLENNIICVTFKTHKMRLYMISGYLHLKLIVE